MPERGVAARRRARSSPPTKGSHAWRTAAKDISILKGLQPVRERPGMYIGSTGPSGLHHLVYEVVDNAVDEALAGYATRIDITLLADGGCRVVDNGRGIPVDPHPEYPDKSAAEIVLTMLHAGGKFGGEGYKISGGLHGVGVSVVNALSRRLELEIRPRRRPLRDGVRRRRRARRARSSASATPTSTARPSRSGPTPRSWKRSSSAPQTLLERLREMAFLNKSLEIVFRDERRRTRSEQVFKYDGGIVDFVAHLNASKEPLFAAVIVVRRHRRRRRGRDRACSGTPATTRASTRSRTTSPPPKAGCTRRASRRPSPTW